MSWTLHFLKFKNIELLLFFKSAFRICSFSINRTNNTTDNSVLWTFKLRWVIFCLGVRGVLSGGAIGAQRPWISLIYGFQWILGPDGCWAPPKRKKLSHPPEKNPEYAPVCIIFVCIMHHNFMFKGFRRQSKQKNLIIFYF